MPLIPIGSRHVFIDESGDPSPVDSSAGTSDYFVLSAVIVESDDVPEGEAAVRQIVDRYFPKGELKSSRIGNNSKRRREILQAISKLKFKHYSHVIDKTRIFKDSPLKYRRTFVKFINRSMYLRLFESFSDLHVIVDQHGTSEFMAGFAEYLDRRLPRRLFETSSFGFGDSRAVPFIQVADVIAGSILRAYSGREDHSVLDPIRAHTILVNEWPPRVPKPEGFENLPDSEQLDFVVRENAVRHAESFVDSNYRRGDDDTTAQVAAMQYLLYHYRSVDPEEYLPTARMHEYLLNLGFELSLRAVRERIIGRLRDHGVVIASGRSGIKLPYCVDDLHAYAEMVGSIVVPYLRRLERARSHYLLATEGELDIVEEDRQADLHQFLKRD